MDPFISRCEAGEPIVLTGVGKSFQVAQLGASLLQSVYCNAVAIHATDMLHGGLNYLPRPGLTPHGALLAISHSGETVEVLQAVAHARERTYIASIVGCLETDLSFSSHHVYSYDIESDGSRHGTIPAASVLEQVKILTSITCELADLLTKEDLAVGHPGGSLGKVYTQ